MSNNIYCTLFNSSYLDKGIVLYESLERVCKEFTLYVLSMDDKCFEVLSSLSKENLHPIRLSDFENDKLREAKSNRNFGEYCWTCSSSLIRYVLEEFSEPICTYVDADMCFYEDPVILINEMLYHKAEVLVVGHRFNSFEKKDRELISGKYCVQFNTFLNTERSRALLDIWINQCLASCSATTGGGILGDQMYLTNWCDDYSFVWETQNLGAGVAPWNIKQYKMLSRNNNHYSLSFKNGECQLIFYHFENITYRNKNIANINVYEAWGIDHYFVRCLYFDYLKRIDNIKDMLKEKYNMEILIKRHPVRNNEGISFKKRVINVLTNIGKIKKLKHYLLSSIPKYLNKNKNIIVINP